MTIGIENASQKRTNRLAFSPASMLSVPAICDGWLAMMPTERPSMRPKPITMFGGEQRLDLEEVAFVDDVLDHRVDVVGLVRRVRHDRVQRAVGVGGLELEGALVRGQLRHVVVGEEAEERARVVDRIVLILGEIVRDAGAGVVRVRAAELLHTHVLAGDGLDHVGSGDEQDQGLVDHDDEVGECRRVHSSSGGRGP